MKWFLLSKLIHVTVICVFAVSEFESQKHHTDSHTDFSSVGKPFTHLFFPDPVY